MFERLRRRAGRLRARAVDELLASQQRDDLLGAAVRQVQRGRRNLDDRGAKVLGSLGVATKEDLEKVSRRLARLRKRLETLVDELS